MQTVFYKVAGHTYKLTFADDNNSKEIIKSSEPFIVEGLTDGTQLLFELIVDDTFRPDKKGEEIGQFDCGGCDYGVYQLADGTYQILIRDYKDNQCALLEVKEDFTIGHVALNGDYTMRNFGLNNTLMLMYAFSAALKNTVLMHSSVVRKDGKGYMCLGESGTGKSTHTGLWLKYIEGTDLMNDDNPVVRVTDDGIARVYGSPWSGKTPCYRNVEAPIGSFIQLRQAPYNKITRESTIEAFASLLPSCSVMKWDEKKYKGICSTVAKLIEKVPNFLLECLPDEAACKLSYTTCSKAADK
ncbi:MAG: hypothetical protein K6E54_01755 [Bacteroidaceae bacterium]|nr:hypothetical protein [Bacteroidaceae bacterium]